MVRSIARYRRLFTATACTTAPGSDVIWRKVRLPAVPVTVRHRLGAVVLFETK